MTRWPHQCLSFTFGWLVNDGRDGLKPAAVEISGAASRVARKRQCTLALWPLLVESEPNFRYRQPREWPQTPSSRLYRWRKYPATHVKENNKEIHPAPGEVLGIFGKCSQIQIGCIREIRTSVVQISRLRSVGISPILAASLLAAAMYCAT